MAGRGALYASSLVSQSGCFVSLLGWSLVGAWDTVCRGVCWLGCGVVGVVYGV